jgi:hypothetical protein
MSGVCSSLIQLMFPFGENSEVSRMKIGLGTGH